MITIHVEAKTCQECPYLRWRYRHYCGHPTIKNVYADSEHHLKETGPRNDRGIHYIPTWCPENKQEKKMGDHADDERNLQEGLKEQHEQDADQAAKDKRAENAQEDKARKAAADPGPGALVVLPTTGEAIDFDAVIAAVDDMEIEQVAEVCAALHCSGKLTQLNTKLKNRVLDHMHREDASIIKVVSGEIKLQSSTKYEYDTEALEKIPEAVEAITYTPKVDKRVLNKAAKLGGKVKAAIEEATRASEPTYRLAFERKIQAEVEPKDGGA